MVKKSTWLSRSLGLVESPHYVTPTKPWPRTVARVIGEDAPADMGSAKPPRPEPEIPAQPGRPDDSNFASQADLTQATGEDRLTLAGQSSSLDQALSMWRSGGKYDAAEFILNSEFSYADLVRLLHMMEPDESVELGTILDEISPPQDESEQEGSAPTDTVSAATGMPPRAEIKPEAPEVE